MNVYHGIVGDGGSVVHCDRLDDFFKEFIEYHKWKATSKNFNKDIFPFKEWRKYSEDGCWKIFYLDLDFDDVFKGKRKKPIGYFDTYEFDYSTGWNLGINIKALKIKKDQLNNSDWNQQKQKIEKVLKDIWTTGKIKDTYGLDLNWPSSKKVKATENLILNKDKTNESVNEQLSRENNKIYWTIGGLFLIIGLIVWFALKRTKNK